MNPVAPTRTRRQRSRGQSLAEFAIVFPVLMLIIGAIIQFGLIFWAQNTLVQVVRDTGRWASTQQSCTNVNAVIATANSIAGQSSLLGYSTGSWSATNVFVTWPPTDGPDAGTANDPCPPTSNQELGWVQVRISHNVPVFFPLVPGVVGTIESKTEFRMEPANTP